MAVIQNDRDVLLQAAAVRVVPVPIPISQVEGLEDELDNLGNSVTSALNNTKNLAIYADAISFIGTTTTSPTSITLTAEKRNGLTGTVSWGVIYGSATITPSGDTCSVDGASVTGSSVTIRARVTVGATNHDAYVTLTKLGTLAGQATVNLATQVTGQLASGNITGLGALATLNTVNLNTQTTGALNGQTQVTNLGTLAYANAIAANQIGAGTLAAGVIYAGAINADNITSGTITGRSIRTATSGARITLDAFGQTAHQLTLVGSTGVPSAVISTAERSFKAVDGSTVGLSVSGATSSGVGLDVYSGWSTGGTSKAIVARSESGGTGTSNALDISCEGSGIVRLTSRSSLPTDRTNGNICFYNGNICVANGSHWFSPGGMIQLT